MRFSRAAAVVLVSCVALSASAQPEGPLPFAGGEVDQDTILEGMQSRYPRTFRQVGTTSVTMRMDLGGSLHAAFKPRTSSHPRGYLAEIAAYRIARLLRMDNVPPVVGRRVPRALMRAQFQSDHPEDWEPVREEIRWDAPGVARGAVIYWIPHMRSSELSTEEGIDAVASWLRVDGELPEESSVLARDLSALFAFDYLIGNWDRLSGGNISTTEEGDRLFVRDHNVAFQPRLRGGRYRRIRGNLERVQRFSRDFVRAVEGIDRESLTAALSEDPESEERSILTEEQIDGVLTRARALLSYVAALVEVYGPARVFVW